MRWLLFSDRQSRSAFRGAYTGNGEISVRLRALEGHALVIRRGTDDPYAVRAGFTWSDQLPPDDVRPRVILDLGAHIGVSMALFASRFPEAKIIGLEPEPDNARLCRLNIAPWSNRCQVIEAAVWTQDGTVHLAGNSTSTHSVQDAGRDVHAISLSTLVQRYGPIDYIKMDIEGAEHAVLGAGGDWVESVSCINVETHAPYTPAQCRTDLERLGFASTLSPAPRLPCVIGRRPPARS